MKHKLSDFAVSNAKAGRLADGGGLYLVTRDSGAQAWILRFWLNGKVIERGLGSFPQVKLAEARKKADEWKDALKADPTWKYQAKPVAAVITFRDAAYAVQALREPSWKSEVHKAQWVQSLDDYAHPRIGDKAVAEVTLSDVEAIMLQTRTINKEGKQSPPLWQEKHATAQKLLSRIGMILDWAIAKGLRTDNPAKANGPLKFLLPVVNYKARHHPALPYTELAAFMAELRKLDSVSSHALEFTILTACRTTEVIEAKWSEIEGDMWVIPAERMKGGKEHRVPLSAQAKAILERVKVLGRDWVFPSRGSHLSNMAMLMCLKGLRPALTVHGFRSTFRDWAAEQTNYPRAVCEAALAHTVASDTETAYLRTDFFDRRRDLMNDWAAYLGEGT